MRPRLVTPAHNLGMALISAVMCHNWPCELKYNIKSFQAINRMIGKRDIPMTRKYMELSAGELLDLVEAVEGNLANKAVKYVNL